MKDYKIIELINNKIKDEYGREIRGIALGICKCGNPYSNLIVRDLDDGLFNWNAWCGECNIFTNLTNIIEDNA